MEMTRLFHRLRCRYFCVACSALVLLQSADQAALARPPYKHSLKKLYGARLNANLHQCATCHLSKDEVGLGEAFDEENPPHNALGERLRELGDAIGEEEPGGDILARLRRIAYEDADGDGVANELEILAGTYPGRAQSLPDEQALMAARDALAAREREATGYAWEPFQRVTRPEVPESKISGWGRTPIDAFIAAEYDRLGLLPTAESAKHHLLRRVYLDLVGLPPTREQLLQFLADDSPTAYEQVVERLLASPAYGQRWGRHWMDIWRYSDWAGWTGGGQIRDSQPHIWRWRDWIIESLNADQPYDLMVRAMLAADEATPDDANELRATGYLVRNYKMLSRETWMQDTVEHTCKAFLAITMNCARCHDHMYDPISQAEYYQFRAIFEPHNVRADRVANLADAYAAGATVDGLTRAYDAEPDVPTFLFVKGDDRNPDKERAINAGVPALLGEKLVVASVTLPVSAYYPGMQPWVRKQLVDAARQALEKARQDLANSETASADASKVVANENATDEHRSHYELAQQRVDVMQFAVEAAETQLKVLQAKMAADDLKYTSAQTPKAEFESAEKQAAILEQDVSLQSLELASRQAELGVAEAESKLKSKPDDASLKKNVADARPKLEQAAKAFEEAKKKSAKTPATYSPLTPVYPPKSSGRRSALAEWLTSRDNPLLARVAVNHIWNRHFGRGLVPSVFDFGQNGKPPTHPALLDWLAVELMEPTQIGNSTGDTRSVEPWSMKHIHRLIVTSSVYRLSTQASDQNRILTNPATSELHPATSKLHPATSKLKPATSNSSLEMEKDPDNEYLTRAPTKRMEAEIVRDAVLYVAGNLDLGMGGPDIDYEMGFQVPRRSLYFRHAAEKEMTFLKIFDAAAVSECYQRKSSVMPQQALAMINSELTISQARRLVRYWKEEPLADSVSFVKAMFEHILSRPATDDEVTTCVQFLMECANRPMEVEVAAKLDDLSRPSSDPATRAREQLVHVLINHHEFVSIY
jgi:Protein of unknown function (DUF1549)/Protein of unknown function (DUF1553)